MGKSKKGGVFGYLRGRVGDVSYSILSAKRSSSGKKEQIVRILPDSVENPNTVGQIMQRMKVKPASKFYAALETILSNAFEGVTYGETSRRYFMKKAMELQDGPYIPKGVDRFIPAEYLMSEGSLNSFPLLRSQASDRVLHTDIDLVVADLNPQGVANALGVPVNTQISFVIINNENGIFVPHYAGFDQRITIADLPEAALVNTGVAPFGSFGIDVANLGIPGLTMTNWVAACVILSIQDASGAWLRSTQNMVLNTTMYNDLYSEDALNAAIASYREASGNNSIGSPWYLNLGMNQAFNGRITAGAPASVAIDLSSPWAGRVVLGEETINTSEGGFDYTEIRQSVFATDLTDNGLIVVLRNGVATTDPALTVGAYRAAFGADARPVLQWYNTYAAQGGYTWQGGSASEQLNLYFRQIGETELRLLVDNDGKVVANTDDETSTVIVYNNGSIVTMEGYDAGGASDPTPQQIRDCVTAWGRTILNFEYGGQDGTTVPYGGRNWFYAPGASASQPATADWSD